MSNEECGSQGLQTIYGYCPTRVVDIGMTLLFSKCEYIYIYI